MVVNLKSIKLNFSTCIFFGLLLFAPSCKPKENFEGVFPDSHVWDLTMNVSFDYAGRSYKANGFSRLCVYHMGAMQEMFGGRWEENWSGSGAHVEVSELGHVVVLWPKSQVGMIVRTTRSSKEYFKGSRNELFDDLSRNGTKLTDVRSEPFRVVVFTPEGGAEFYSDLNEFTEFVGGKKSNLEAEIHVKPTQGGGIEVLQVVDQPWYIAWKSDRGKYLTEYHREWLSDDIKRSEFPVELNMAINKLRDEDFSRKSVAVFGNSDAANKINGLCGVGS